MQISIPYPGGKFRIHKQIMSEFPPIGNKYIELFAGRGNIFFNFKQLASYNQWFLNDKFTGKYFQSISLVDPESLPIEITYELFEALKVKSLMNNPLAMILEPHITFRGKGYNAGPQIDKGHFERYNKSTFKDKLLKMKSLLQDVTVSCLDYTHLDLDNLTDEDFIYCDPPYLYTDGVGYANINHMELIGLLQNTEAQWAVSGYENEMYLAELGEPILRIERNLEMSEKSNQVIECLWRS